MPYERYPSVSYSILPNIRHRSSGQSTMVFVHRPNDRREMLSVRVCKSNSAIHRRDAIRKNMHAISRQATTAPALSGGDDPAEASMAAKIATTPKAMGATEANADRP